jgi:hypothetical protein
MPVSPLTRVPVGTVIKLGIVLPDPRKTSDGLMFTVTHEGSAAEIAAEMERKLVARFIDKFLPHDRGE